MIEILVLQALAYQLQGDVSAALASLERALALAEPEGYFRIFLNEGAEMTKLLREAAAHGIMPDYTGKLLGAFEENRHTGVESAGKSFPRSSQPLIEPLTERELEVLRLFRTELSGPEIARELGVTHVIEGSLVTERGRLRVTAQLIDAASDRHVWARTYDRPARDVLGVQADVAVAIARDVGEVVVRPDAR